MAIILSEVGTVVAYSASIMFLGSIINTSEFSFSFLLRVLAITAIAWAPFELISWIYHKIYPTDLDKISEEAKARSKIKEPVYISKGSILLTDLEHQNDSGISES